MDPIQVLTSKGFKQVQYKVAADKRRPCYYLNFTQGCRGKRVARLLVYLGSDDLLVCFEVKEWPQRYRSKGIKLRLPGLDEDMLLIAMRTEWKNMVANHTTVELKDARRNATEGEVQARIDQLAGKGPPLSDVSTALVQAVAKAVVNKLGVEGIHKLAHELRTGGQMALPFK